jgi:hypothetical protein
LRINGLPKKIYLGKGAAAAAQAERDAQARQERQARREALEAEKVRLARALGLSADLRALADLLVSAALVLQGFHLRRGEWRRWRRPHESEAQAADRAASQAAGGA